MKVKELKDIIKNLDDDIEVMIIDSEHSNCYDIIDSEICEDKFSPFYNSFLDLVIDMEE